VDIVFPDFSSPSVTFPPFATYYTNLQLDCGFVQHSALPAHWRVEITFGTCDNFFYCENSTRLISKNGWLAFDLLDSLDSKPRLPTYVAMYVRETGSIVEQ
jgi:hypothetical protein